MLDLFCGRFGWSKAFAERGWECVGVDLVEPPEIPEGCRFIRMNILHLDAAQVSNIYHPDFICASSPCEEFSVHGMKHFHPNPKYPQMGLELFNHTRALCEASGVPYVMENVRAAQKFVGNAVNHCGPFYLWGSGVPVILPLGIRKGISHRVPGIKTMTRAEISAWRRENDPMWSNSHSEKRKQATAMIATIPPELAAAVADYATRLYEQRKSA